MLDLLTVGFFPELTEYFVRGRVSQVGADECGFQVVQRSAVNLLADGNDFLDALAEVFAGTRHRLFHAIEEARLLLLVQAAKKGLNHRNVESRVKYQL